MRSRRCCISTTPARTASGFRTGYGGKENLGAIAFLRQLNESVYRDHPDVQVIAEESTSWPMVSRPVHLGGLGFGLKWNMGWMHDTLDYFRQEPIHRKYHHDRLTFSIWYAFTENFVLRAVARRGRVRQGIAARQDAGRRLAEVRESAAAVRDDVGASGQEAPVHGRRVRPAPRVDARGRARMAALTRAAACRRAAWVADLNALLRAEPALHEVDFDAAGFEWIDARDADRSVLTFIRRPRKGRPVLVACNFTPVPRIELRRRRAPGGSLAGAPEQRRIALRRQRHGQLRRRGRGTCAGPRALSFAVAHVAAARDGFPRAVGPHRSMASRRSADRSQPFPAEGRARAVIEADHAERRRRPLRRETGAGRRGAGRSGLLHRRPRRHRMRRALPA